MRALRVNPLSLRLRLPSCFLLLLPRAHAEERFGRVDVRGRTWLRVTERLRDLLPPRGREREALAEHREEDLRLLVAVAGERLQSREDLLGIVDAAPHVRGVAVVLV